MRRYLILISCVLMLAFLGTNQAWSVFVRPLRLQYGFSAFQMQLIFATVVFIFCTTLVAAGRLHDRFGPRPLATVSAVMIGIAWTLAWRAGGNFWLLWFSIGLIGSTGSAMGYVCPLATAMKWFPNHRGLVSGLAAAGFAGGPIMLSFLAEALMARGWTSSSVFGLLATTYSPAILLLGLTLALPPGQPSVAQVTAFRREELAGDRRMWTLFLGMFTGTLPFLVVMGNAKPLALDFGLIETVAALAIPVLASGNAFGRIFWGGMIDRLGPRRSILGAQAVVVASLILLMTVGNRAPLLFFIALFGIGFCYGSNFAIYPATVARIFGAHVLGSVYPFIMVAQAIASFAAMANGRIKDATGSNLPGLTLALGVAVTGSTICYILGRSLVEPKGTETKEVIASPAGQGDRNA